MNDGKLQQCDYVTKYETKHVQWFSLLDRILFLSLPRLDDFSSSLHIASHCIIVHLLCVVATIMKFKLLITVSLRLTRLSSCWCCSGGLKRFSTQSQHIMGCNVKPSNVHTCICIHMCTHAFISILLHTYTHQKHQQFLWFEFPFDLSFAICVFTEWCWSIATLFSLHFAYISTHSTFAFSLRDRGNKGTSERDNLRQRRRQIFGEISTTFLTIVIILNYFIFSARNKSFWLLLLLLRLVVMLVMVLQQ